MALSFRHGACAFSPENPALLPILFLLQNLLFLTCCRNPGFTEMLPVW